MIATSVNAACMIATKCPTVVIVEDDELFREYLSGLFKANSCQVREAAGGRDLFDIVAAEPVDCVILDYRLADENGLSIHERLKDGMRDAPPIVMLTAERDEQTIIKAFRSGVSDYVLKRDLDPEELFRAVKEAMERREQARIRNGEMVPPGRRTEFDDATGLYSRASIDERLAVIARKRRAVSYAIILISVDNLDEVGEKFGQAAADSALRAFVTRLKKVLGPHDIGGRYDGARFISITDIDIRFKPIEFACTRMAHELSFDLDLGATTFKLTASIGAAIYPLDGRTMDAAIAAADQALKNAKARGIAFATADAAYRSNRRTPAAASRNDAIAP